MIYLVILSKLSIILSETLKTMGLEKLTNQLLAEIYQIISDIRRMSLGTEKIRKKVNSKKKKMLIREKA